MNQIWQIGAVLLDRYLIQAEMGRGMLGVSCQARDLKTNSLVVLWPIPAFISHNEYEFITLKRNFAHLQQLDHKHIAKAYALEHDLISNTWFYVMEYVVGINLYAWCQYREQGIVALSDALRISQQIADALDFAHRLILHRNLRPQNIIIMPDMNVKLLGFDLLSPALSRMIRAEYLKTHQEHAFEIHNYLAPELFFDFIPPGITVDHYSLAVLFYAMVTGRLPFAVTNSRELMHAVCNLLPSAVPTLDRKSNQALLQGMDKDPGNRFHLAMDFVHSIRSSPSIKMPARWASTSAALMATCGIAWFVITTPSQSAALFFKATILASVEEVLPMVPPALVERFNAKPFESQPTVQLAAVQRPPATHQVAMPDFLLLRVDSRPTGATLILDGKRMGTTPFTLGAVKPGKHTVRMEKAQFSPVEMELELTKDTIVDLTLESLPSSPDMRMEKAQFSPVKKEPELTKDPIVDLTLESLPSSPLELDPALPNPLLGQMPSSGRETKQATLMTPQQEPTSLAQEQQENEIAALLKLANRYFQEDRLTRPRNSHALAIYRKILALSPDHPDAKQGMQNIIKRLLLLSQEDLAGWRLIRPMEKNAMEKYRSILMIDPDNALAKSGLEEIVDRLLSLAQRFADNPEKSLEYLQQAEEVMPGLPRIAAARVEIFPKSARNPESYGHPVSDEHALTLQP